MPVKRTHLNLLGSVLNDPKSATHFLCFPLCTQRSQPKLQTLVQTLRENENAIGIPREAFRLPKSFVLRVRELRIETDDGIHVALDILHCLDLRDLLESRLHGDATLRNGVVYSQSTSVAPLKLTLKGITAHLNDKLHDPSKTNQMWGLLHDPSNRIRPFMQNIRREFEALATPDKVPGLPWDSGRTASEVTAPNLIATRFNRKHDTFVNKLGVLRRRLISPRFDPRGLVENFGDTLWAEDIQIEKLSLCKEGRMKTFGGPNNDVLVDEGYEEIASIPLPQ